MNEVAIKQGLQTEVGELQVTVCIHRLAQALKVVLRKTWVEQFKFNRTMYVVLEIAWVQISHLSLGCNIGIHAKEAQCIKAQ